MQLFTPPKTKYKNYYEEGAYNLTWRLNAFMSISFLGFILAGYVISNTLVMIGILTWIIPVTSLIILKKTKKYEYIAYAHVFIGIIVNGIIMNAGIIGIPVANLTLILIAIFYAFIALRRLIGMISLFVGFIFVMFYICTFSNTLIDVEQSERASVMISTLTAFALFGFLVIEFLRLRKIAEGKYVGVNKDLIKINELVNSQNTEKTVMLKEIHHRVKNNLQVISSLLRLQSYEIEEEESKRHFQDAIYRVSAMALIHEKMYKNENLSDINLENYIETLAEDLIQIHARQLNVKLTAKSGLQEIENDTLVPVALILNELITNSLKHAFVEEEEGKIDINISELSKEGYFNFIYVDSGKWKASEKTNSFGLELIATLTEQLDGKVERSYSDGTRYEFTLKDLK